MALISTIHQWKKEFVGDQVQFCARSVSNNKNCLTSHELEHITKAVAIRQNTYSTGRLCAKTALKNIGIEPSEYPRGLLTQQDGSVAWPVGAIGSVSHTNEWAMAAVAKTMGHYLAIGIDIEEIDRVQKNVQKHIATDHERKFLDATNTLVWETAALFSIKESLYKCLRATYGEFIRFHDVELSNLTNPLAGRDGSQPDSAKPAFYQPSVQLLNPSLAACCAEHQLEIRLAVLERHVVSFVGYV